MMHGISECCRYCTEKYEACHDYCETYLAAREAWETRKAKIKAAKEDEFYIYKLEKKRKQRRSEHGK